MLKSLNLVERFDYAPDSGGHLGLCLIDRKKLTCESIESDNEHARRYSYGQLLKCREQFSIIFTEETKSILFTHAIDSSNKIAEFINLIEERLKLPKNNKCQFFLIKDYRNVTAIRVSEFFRSSVMARQIFTMFLRVGRKYTVGRTIQDCLNDEKNYQNCWPAIELFLEGYYNFDQKIINTWNKDFHHGFVFSFINRTKEEIIQQNLMTKN